MHDFLDESKLTDSPIELFESWLKFSIENNEEEPTVMILSTSFEGQPDSRVVLLKGIEQGGFVFFTNYLSNKGRQLNHNNRVALNFFWPKSERQVRIKGIVDKLPEDASIAYFDSRPVDSQLGAWASAQSQEISSRMKLEEKFEFYKQKFQQEQIYKPPHWGGYIVTPFEVEFWQGRPNRLHDRFLYVKDNQQWQIKRLSP